MDKQQLNKQLWEELVDDTIEMSKADKIVKEIRKEIEFDLFKEIEGA